MPELHFKGKEFVYNHHLSVPYRPLVPHAGKSIGKTRMDGNLVIHGDNLHALKALMPLYAGKVGCIYIDPPYNTGTQTWRYSDNLNNPIFRQWLKENPVNAEDMLRHDKWLCMMYPRVVLLRELLADSGTLWMSIDDGEVANAREMLNEIFGEECFIAQFVWKSRASEDARAKTGVSEDHEYMLCYGRQKGTRLRGTEKDLEKFANPDEDKRGPWRSADLTGLATKDQRPNLHYDLINPASKINYGCPPKGWRFEKPVMQKKISEKRVLWPASRDGRPRHKLFLSEMRSQFKNASSVITHATTSEGTREVNDILGLGEFDFPKPTALIRFVLEQATSDDTLVLDSFAGSGTTAHAVMLQNDSDGGSRRCILVEQEEYADELTAERVRRVIEGYKFEGSQSEELHQENLTFTSLKRADQILEHVASIENLDGHRFDRIERKVSDGILTITGETKVKKKVEGLGGEFTYCTLGAPVDLDKLLTGDALPAYDAIGAWLFHTATGEAFVSSAAKSKDFYLGESSAYHVWLIYKPELDFLKSPAAALTLSFAEKVGKAKKGKKHLVFAPAKFVPNKTLLPMGVEFAPLPYALYRVEKA